MTTIADLRRAAEDARDIAQARADRHHEAARAIIEQARAQGRELTDAEFAEASRLAGIRDAARLDLAGAGRRLSDIAKAEADEAEAARQFALRTPTGAAPPGRTVPAPAGAGIGHEQDRAADAGWTRASDGRRATVARGERFGDHEVVAEHAARHAARERPILDAYSGVGQLVRSMTTSTGSAIVPTMWASRIIDRARNYAAVLKAGTEIVPMDSKIVQVGRLTADPGAAGFRSEGSTITAGDPTFDNVTLTATTLSALTVASLEFMQDALNVDQVIEEAMAQAMGLALDLACIYGGTTSGSGSINLPVPPNVRGILQNLLANASSSVLGNQTNGTVQTATSVWNEILSLIYTPRQNNEAPNALLWPTRLHQKYAQTYDTQNRPMTQPPDVDAMTKIETNQLLSGQTQGTGTLMCDAVAGDFTKAILGQRMDFSIRLLTERYADAGQVGIVGMWRGDFQLARPRAFAFFRYLQGV